MSFIAEAILRKFFNGHGDYIRRPEFLDDRPWWRIWWHTKRRVMCVKNIRYALRCAYIAPKGKKLMTFRWAMRL